MVSVFCYPSQLFKEVINAGRLSNLITLDIQSLIPCSLYSDDDEEEQRGHGFKAAMDMMSFLGTAMCPNITSLALPYQIPIKAIAPLLRVRPSTCRSLTRLTCSTNGGGLRDVLASHTGCELAKLVVHFDTDPFYVSSRQRFVEDVLAVRSVLPRLEALRLVNNDPDNDVLDSPLNILDGIQAADKLRVLDLEGVSESVYLPDLCRLIRQGDMPVLEELFYLQRQACHGEGDVVGAMAGDVSSPPHIRVLHFETANTTNLGVLQSPAFNRLEDLEIQPGVDLDFNHNHLSDVIDAIEAGRLHQLHRLAFYDYLDLPVSACRRLFRVLSQGACPHLHDLVMCDRGHDQEENEAWVEIAEELKPSLVTIRELTCVTGLGGARAIGEALERGGCPNLRVVCTLTAWVQEAIHSAAKLVGSLSPGRMSVYAPL